MQAFDVTWGDVDGDVVIENAYANVSQRRRHARRLADGRRRVSSRSATRGATAARRSTRASRSIAGRWPICSTRSISRTIPVDGHALGRLPRLRSVHAAVRLRPDDASTTGTAYGEPLRDRVGRRCASRATACASTASRSPRAAARSPARPSSAGTAPTRSTPRAAGSRSRRSTSRRCPTCRR